MTIPRCIVLTEDALKRSLEVLLEASGLPMHDTLVLAYYGCTSPHNLRPLLDLIRASNPSAKIIVHRDRDYLTDDEASEWSTELRSMGTEPFLSDGVDIESHFLIAAHLAKLNSKSESEMQELLDSATSKCGTTTIEKYVNGRTDIEKKKGTFGKLNLGQLAAGAGDVIDSNPVRFRHSKSVLKIALQKFQESEGKNLQVLAISNEIVSQALVDIAKKVTRRA